MAVDVGLTRFRVSLFLCTMVVMTVGCSDQVATSPPSGATVPSGAETSQQIPTPIVRPPSPVTAIPPTAGAPAPTATPPAKLKPSPEPDRKDATTTSGGPGSGALLEPASETSSTAADSPPAPVSPAQMATPVARSAETSEPPWGRDCAKLNLDRWGQLTRTEKTTIQNALRQLARDNVEALWNHPAAMGTGIGTLRKDGERGNEIGIVVGLSNKKLKPEMPDLGDVIPDRIGCVKVAVEERGVACPAVLRVATARVVDDRTGERTRDADWRSQTKSGEHFISGEPYVIFDSNSTLGGSRSLVSAALWKHQLPSLSFWRRTAISA